MWTAPYRLVYLGKREEYSLGMRMFTAIIQREDGGYSALCPELDIASQGETIELARDNLTEAIELFLETASTDEIAMRLKGDVYVTQVGVEFA